MKQAPKRPHGAAPRGRPPAGNDPPAVKLRRFVEEYLRNLPAHPGAYVSQILVMVEQSTEGRGARGRKGDLLPSFRAMRDLGIAHLNRILGDILGSDDEHEVSLRALQLLTSVAHPVFLSDFPRALFDIDLSRAADRAAYVDHLMAAATRPLHEPSSRRRAR